MKQFTPLLLLVVALSSTTASRAASVTITDTIAPGGNHSPIGHWQQFSTTLSASADTPEPQAETTITGPIYRWSGGSGAVHRNSDTGQQIGLESTLGNELPAGPNTVNVQCEATFTRTKDGQTLSPIVLTGSFSVNFFSRVPKKVVEITRYPSPGSPYLGPNDWGQETSFDLQLRDNQSDAKPYGFADIRESFLPPFTGDDDKPNGDRGPYTWYVLSAGHNNPNGSNIVDGNFSDHNGVTSPADFRNSPYNWPENRVTNGFDQGWTCFEAKPPYPSAYDQSISLPGHHHVTVHYMTPTDRTGG